jgi:hypothetical protein
LKVIIDKKDLIILLYSFLTSELIAENHLIDWTTKNSNEAINNYLRKHCPPEEEIVDQNISFESLVNEEYCRRIIDGEIEEIEE